jgi:hypothetical protein
VVFLNVQEFVERPKIIDLGLHIAKIGGPIHDCRFRGIVLSGPGVFIEFDAGKFYAARVSTDGVDLTTKAAAEAKIRLVKLLTQSPLLGSRGETMCRSMAIQWNEVFEDTPVFFSWDRSNDASAHPTRVDFVGVTLLYLEMAATW